ncbi:NUDIX domain-containing protein [Nocardioides sp. YIM 152588]|uniref:NUDIX hydrolase n=1 Tax=Nocardioides sp. YIM 152588 TaxID=3158259 RepID=UPI0032E4B5CC
MPEPTTPPVSSPEPPIRVVAVAVRDADGRFLTVRKRGTTAFMQPGGKPEPGETPEQTGVREIREELGAEVADVARLGEWTAPAANEHGRTIEAVVLTARLVSLTGPQAEIEELMWWDPADASVPADRIAPLLRDVVAPTLADVPPS